MRESRTSGSVRGARDNPRPYRYPLSAEPRNTTKWVARASQARGSRDYPFQTATRHITFPMLRMDCGRYLIISAHPAGRRCCVATNRGASSG
jgi:hypothetical protein